MAEQSAPRRQPGEVQAGVGQRAAAPPVALGPPEREAERAELREYLGARYDERLLHGHRRAVQDELRAVGEEDRFYRVSEAYLYDLTAFAMSGAKLPYLERLVRLVPPPASVLDFGCGIGSDGLALAAHGYTVTFADFENPSTRYLRWRLARRGLPDTFVDLDRGRPESGQRLAFSFDVIEHVGDPFAFLDELGSLAEVALVNLLAGEDGESNALHHPLPVGALVRHAARRWGIAHHSVHHGRSHLLAYGRGARRLAGGLAIARTLRV